MNIKVKCECLKEQNEQKLHDFYFSNFALNNEDEVGFERWLENLTEEEIDDLLN